MAYDSDAHDRRSIRSRHYDYSQSGAYFITICVQGKRSLFGEVVGDEMRPNSAGRMICTQWHELPNRFPKLELDFFVVMPNHIHGILVIKSARSVQGHDLEPSSRSITLCDVVGAFKSITTVEYVRGVKIAKWPSFEKRLWQRNYYEHIIRDESSLNSIREYIVHNPRRWTWDRENPKAMLEPET